MPIFSGLFPMSSPKDTRFAINYFTSIGLGSLTDKMRIHLQNMPKKDIEEEESSSGSDSMSDDSSDSDSLINEPAKRTRTG